MLPLEHLHGNMTWGVNCPSIVLLGACSSALGSPAIPFTPLNKARLVAAEVQHDCPVFMPIEKEF